MGHINEYAAPLGCVVAAYVGTMMLYHTIRTAGWTALYLFGKLFKRKSSDGDSMLEKVRTNAVQLGWFTFNRGRREFCEGMNR